MIISKHLLKKVDASGIKCAYVDLGTEAGN